MDNRRRMMLAGGISADPVLENNDWETISKLASNGEAANIWSIGDIKSVKLNGKVGALTFNNQTYNCFILGFSHNEAREGKGIHFSFGKTLGSKDIAFCDSYYNKTEVVHDCFNMNYMVTNQNGWEGSTIRKYIIPAFLNSLPLNLKSKITACIKFTDNVGNANSQLSSVTSTEDYIFLLSEFEVAGIRSKANQYEQNYQKQYDYYKFGNSKIRYKHNAEGNAAYWWLRSPAYNASSHFCYVELNGSVAITTSSYSLGFVPCFKVGA